MVPNMIMEMLSKALETLSLDEVQKVVSKTLANYEAEQPVQGTA